MADEKTPEEKIDETEATEAPPEATPAAEETPAVEETAGPAAEEAPAPAADASADTEAPAEGEAAEAAVSGPKKKRKRLPRSERHKHSKPKREPASQRKPITRLPKPESVPGRRQERRGVVVSDAMDKTIVVKVDVIKSHPRYKKVVRRTVKFHAHDEGNAAKIGDVVRIVETRPLSKSKNWRLAEVVEAAR